MRLGGGSAAAVYRTGGRMVQDRSGAIHRPPLVCGSIVGHSANDCSSKACDRRVGSRGVLSFRPLPEGDAQSSAPTHRSLRRLRGGLQGGRGAQTWPPIAPAGEAVSCTAGAARRHGEVVSREELQALLWPADTFVDFDNGLNNAVNKVRAALGDSASVPKYVETVGASRLPVYRRGRG